MNSRREFVMSAAALAASPGDIPRRPLGKTGLQVSVLGLGGAGIGNLPDLQESVDVVRRCYDLGVNYFDCASSGAYGLSQVRYGVALKGLRDRIVLATKSRNRTWLQAEVDLNQSLQFLGTDHIDLYQVHNLMTEEEFGVMFGPRGVIELIEKAKRDGKIRFVGITCHGDPAVLVRALERYPFDTVLMPLSLTDGASPAEKSFEKTALPVARKKGMGIIAMKALGAGRILKQKTATEKECLEYVFSLPLSTAILGCTDSPQVERNAAVARAAKPLTAAAMEELRRRVSTQELALLEPWKRIENVEPVYRAD